MLIYGRKKIKIKAYEDHKVKCENCGGYSQKFVVFQEYFHLFFIPFFPLGSKTVKSACLKCNDAFNQEKKSHYVAITRTPFYMYSGFIILAGMIIAIIIFVNHADKQKAEYVNNPKRGDVYLMSENSHVYYFVKINDVKGDTIMFLHGYLQYNGYVSNMNDQDYFVKDDNFGVLKSKLKNLLDSGYINSVERDYSTDSRFIIEK